MKYCNNCKMKIENDMKNCPLCNGILEKTDDVFNYDYPVVRHKHVLEIISRSMLFMAIAVTLISAFINTVAAKEFPWFIIASASAFYLFFSTKSFINNHRNYGLLIVSQVILSSLVLAAIDFSIGYTGWSVNYVIPFIIISGSLTASIISIVQPLKYKEYMIYLIIIALLGIVPLILLLTGIADVYWTNAACVLYSALTVLAMIIFTRRRFNTELKKRFHF